MLSAGTATKQRFVRRVSLQPNEYRINFRQIDCDVVATLISDEASKVTPHMSRIYLALITAPSEYWESQGVLRLTGREKKGQWQTPWKQLIELGGVASATLRKAIIWLSGQGIIGYFAGRNGVGIRIFINRAASSIGQKSDQGQKNLHLVRASPKATPTSSVEAPFKESFALLNNLDSSLIPLAPKTGAADTTAPGKLSDADPIPSETCAAHPRPASPNFTENPAANAANGSAIVERIVREVIPHVKAAAAPEHERMREWFISHALPKAIRVAQASAYDVLRAHGLIKETRSRSGSRDHPDDRQVGKYTPTEIAPRKLSDQQINELAESCVALLVTQGQSLDRTLSEMSVEAGGFLLLEDIPKVRVKAEALTQAGAAEQSKGRASDV